MLLYKILAFITHDHAKIHTQIIYQLQRGIINFNYAMDHILYQIFKIILSIF